jgi:hypothetical protein
MRVFYGCQNYKFTARYEIAGLSDRLKILLKSEISAKFLDCFNKLGGLFKTLFYIYHEMLIV